MSRSMSPAASRTTRDWRCSTAARPAPAGIYKLNDRYRYQLTLSCAPGQAGPIRALLAHLLRLAQQDRDNREVALYADHNPQD